MRIIITPDKAAFIRENYLNKKTKKPQWLIDFENYYKLKPYKNN